MVERSIAWLTRGNRRVRYRGISKNGHWLHHRVATINLRRLVVLGLTRTNGNWVIATIIKVFADPNVRVVHVYGLNETYGPCTVCDGQDSWPALPVAKRSRLKAARP